MVVNTLLAIGIGTTVFLALLALLDLLFAGGAGTKVLIRRLATNKPMTWAILLGLIVILGLLISIVIFR